MMATAGQIKESGILLFSFMPLFYLLGNNYYTQPAFSDILGKL